MWCSDGEPSFAEQKAKILEHSSNANLKAVWPLTGAEERLEREIFRPTVKDAQIDSRKSFLSSKADYDASMLLRMMQRMPKGAVLHTHSIASASMRDVIETLQQDSHFHIWQGGSETLEGTLRAFAEGTSPPSGWVRVSEVPASKVYDYLTMPDGLPTVEARWDAFGKLWQRLLPGTAVAPFYFGKGGVLWRILRRFHSSGIIYVEIKETMTPHTEYDGTPISDRNFMGLFEETVKMFCETNPRFIGAKVVLTCVKFQSEEEVAKDFLRSVAMKEEFPHLVAGFDLAGAEDLPLPIEAYVPGLRQGLEVARQKNVTMPLLLHGGETNMPTGDQLIDAILVGSTRIGHGFALSRHPELIDEVKRKGISLECCPISNQVLGYFPDLAAHSALGLFRSGVVVTISGDDPGQWHCDDVSYDWAAIAKAWNLSLAEMKALCRNSIVTSTLTAERKEEAMKLWEEQWAAWVEAELAGVATAN